MISEFDWCGCMVTTLEKKQEVERKIRQDFEARGDVDLKPCHHGQVKVQLNIAGPFFSDLVGNVACSCGKKYLKFRGTSDASTITFERVN